MQAKNGTAPGEAGAKYASRRGFPVYLDSVVVRTELFTMASGLK
jgi:hypothetical protein